MYLCINLRLRLRYSQSPDPPNPTKCRFSVRIRFLRLPCISLIRVLKQYIIILISTEFSENNRWAYFRKTVHFSLSGSFFENKPMGSQAGSIFPGGGPGKLFEFVHGKQLETSQKIYGKTLLLSSSSLTAERAEIAECP